MRRENGLGETEASCSSERREEEKQAQSSDTSTEATAAQTSTSRRKVRFHPSISQVVVTLPTLREIDEDQKRRLWWSLSDYEVFTDTARNISREVRRHPGLTSGLDEAFRKALLASKHVDQVEEAMQQIPLDPGLAHWCTHGHSRRGLERWGSQYHGTSRTDATDSSKSTVVNLNLSGDELAREASRLSLSSRVFARMMGEADEAAAIRTHTELRRWSGGATMRVQAMHRTSSLPLRGLVRTNL
jgi:hypothetical protein